MFALAVIEQGVAISTSPVISRRAAVFSLLRDGLVLRESLGTHGVIAEQVMPS